jgi:sterol desaturase/sphingolipid hydroxylase (fatty acid hydroxylase superfamily)
MGAREVESSSGKRGFFIAASFVAIAVLEEMRPLRGRIERKSRHVLRNLAMAAMSSLATGLMQQRLVAPAAETIVRRRQGLLPRLRLPQSLRVAAGVLLLDYSLWIWHWLNHRCLPLWRFHRVHHVDRDLDSWTALRFHFGEMAMAGVVRFLQIRLIGPDPGSLAIWQTLLLPSIFFHHSKIELPEKVERALSWVIVTPRMHAIHHSMVLDETNSNWSSLLSIWDRLHGTFRLDVPQESIAIGVPAYRRPEDVTLPKLIVMPLRSTRGDFATGSGVD